MRRYRVRLSSLSLWMKSGGGSRGGGGGGGGGSGGGGGQLSEVTVQTPNAKTVLSNLPLSNKRERYLYDTKRIDVQGKDAEGKTVSFTSATMRSTDRKKTWEVRDHISGQTRRISNDRLKDVTERYKESASKTTVKDAKKAQKDYKNNSLL